MTAQHDDVTQKALDKLLVENRLFAETPLYREAMRMKRPRRLSERPATAPRKTRS